MYPWFAMSNLNTTESVFLKCVIVKWIATAIAYLVPSLWAVPSSVNSHIVCHSQWHSFSSFRVLRFHAFIFICDCASYLLHMDQVTRSVFFLWFWFAVSVYVHVSVCTKCVICIHLLMVTSSVQSVNDVKLVTNSNKTSLALQQIIVIVVDKADVVVPLYFCWSNVYGR